MIGFLLALPSAFGAIVPAEYCVRWDLDYDDADVGDFLVPGQNGATDKAARGVLLRFVRPNGSHFGYYMDWEGSDVGCRTIQIDDSVSYEVKVVASAKVDGNTVQVLNASGAMYVSVVDLNHTPVAYSTETFTVGPTHKHNILGAATKALQRDNLGVSDETFTFVTADCMGDDGDPTNDIDTSCNRHISLGKIYIETADQEQDREKYTIVHELGHALSEVRDEYTENQNSGNAPMDACLQQPGAQYVRAFHYVNSKEYQSTAAVEGFAYFYSAAMFNKYVTETNCRIDIGYTPDWDLDGNPEGNEPDVFNCNSGGLTVVNSPNPSLFIDGWDYFGDYCDGTGAVANRGVEYDWMRHFWALLTDYDFTLLEVADIWDEADPKNWNATDQGNASDDPAQRMEDAAFSVGGQAMLDDYATSASIHGTDR